MGENVGRVRPTMGKRRLDPAPPSTPSAQHDGHEHNWKPSPTMNGWQWCDVKGCGMARKKPVVVQEVKGP